MTENGVVIAWMERLAPHRRVRPESNFAVLRTEGRLPASKHNNPYRSIES
jgi:hypothetical protein